MSRRCGRRINAGSHPGPRGFGLVHNRIVNTPQRVPIDLGSRRRPALTLLVNDAVNQSIDSLIGLIVVIQAVGYERPCPRQPLLQ